MKWKRITVLIEWINELCVIIPLKFLSVSKCFQPWKGEAWMRVIRGGDGRALSLSMQGWRELFQLPASGYIRVEGALEKATKMPMKAMFRCSCEVCLSGVVRRSPDYVSRLFPRRENFVLVMRYRFCVWRQVFGFSFLLLKINKVTVIARHLGSQRLKALLHFVHIFFLLFLLNFNVGCSGSTRSCDRHCWGFSQFTVCDFP